jgi:glycosyltransferase involved in cell wall biosynthesis
MIPVYNDATYLRQTLESVLVQDPGAAEMQIEVVDDCSTAVDVGALVRSICGDRVAFHSQPRNLGLIDNFNACIERATGEWVHILHSDDFVRPGFYAHARAAMAAHPEIGAFLCRIVSVDANGDRRWNAELESERPGLLGRRFVERQLVGQRIQFVGMLVRRAVYQALGGFRPDLPLCMDWDMWNRVALSQQLFYDPEPLACFRVHDASAWARSLRDGRGVAEKRRLIGITATYLPPAEADRLCRLALRRSAVQAIRDARHLWRGGDAAAARRMLRDALRCSRNPEILLRLLHALPILARTPPAPLPVSKPCSSSARRRTRGDR